VLRFGLGSGIGLGIGVGLGLAAGGALRVEQPMDRGVAHLHHLIRGRGRIRVMGRVRFKARVQG